MMGPICCSETSVTNYKSRLRDILKDRGPHLHRSGSLKSCKRTVCLSPLMCAFLETFANGGSSADAGLLPFINQHLCSKLGKQNNIPITSPMLFGVHWHHRQGPCLVIYSWQHIKWQQTLLTVCHKSLWAAKFAQVHIKNNKTCNNKAKHMAVKFRVNQE
jgi:hypothetical protein